MTDSAQGLQTRINSLLDKDPRSMIPGASSLQQKAFGAAGGLLGPEARTFSSQPKTTALPEGVTRDANGNTWNADGSLAIAPGTSAWEFAGMDGPSPGQDTTWRAGNGAAQEAVGGLLDRPMTAQQASSRSLLDVDLDAYQNPWLDSVVKSSLAGYDEQRGMQEAEMRAQQARNQKFSGSGDAIRRSMFDRGTLQDRTGIESNLRAEGFDRATGLATSDLNREAETSRFNASQSNTMTAAERDAQLRAAGLLGDLANNQAANQRADLGLLTDMGGVQREIERDELGAETDLLRLVSALNAGQPYSLFHGENRTGNATSTSTSKESGLGSALGTIGSVLSGIGNAAGGAAAASLAFSDKRLKADIKTEGKDHAGRRVVSYRYKGEPKDVRRVGYIAQEVEKTDPNAVVKGPGGYRMVDYGLLGEAA